MLCELALGREACFFAAGPLLDRRRQGVQPRVPKGLVILGAFGQQREGQKAGAWAHVLGIGLGARQGLTNLPPLARRPIG